MPKSYAHNFFTNGITISLLMQVTVATRLNHNTGTPSVYSIPTKSSDDQMSVDHLMQDCSISSALAMEILQSCIKPSKWNLQEPTLSMCCTYMLISTLGPSDTIWRHRSGSSLAQVMACCLMAPSHYLNQCWLIISEVQWHSYQGNFTRDASTINH